MVDTSDTMADSDTTARGLLMLRPIPTFFMEDLDMDTLDTPDTSDTMAMDSDMSTARGLLMLSLRLRLILTTDTVLDTDTVSDTDMVLDTPDTSDMPDTVDTTTESRLHQVLSANQQLHFRQKWIVISLKFPSPVLQFQCDHTKSLVMVSRKQE